jgi:hypothetical protein
MIHPEAKALLGKRVWITNAHSPAGQQWINRVGTAMVGPVSVRGRDPAGRGDPSMRTIALGG